MSQEPQSNPDRRRIATAAVCAACALWLLGALWLTRGHHPVTPDTLHHGIVARNLSRGNGFEINMIQYHVGRFADVEHVAEMHGILQPVALSVLFALTGPERSWFRVPGFLYVALTGVVAFLYARRTFSSRAGFLACALILSSPLLSLWAWLGADDAGFAFWFVASLALLDLAIERPSVGRFAIAGLAAALALLQKLSGLILLAPMLAILLRSDREWRARARWLAIWLAPWSLALLLCLLRNRAASGSWMFRFGPVDWIFKARGFDAFFAVHDAMPSLFGVLSSLGAETVAAIVWRQLGEFAAAALSPTPVFGIDPTGRLMTPSLLSLAGLAALAFHARQRPRFAALTLLSVLGSVGFVCGIWHFELRFFTPLIPLLAISLGGAVFPGAATARPGRGAAALRGAIGCATAAASAVPFALALQGIAHFPVDASCPAAIDWLRRETAPADRILTFDPSRTSWETERAAIVVPYGPRADVEKVVAWYQPAWLFVMPRWMRAESSARIAEMIASPTEAFPVSLAFVDGACSIYRFESASRENPGSGAPRD